MEKYTNRGDDSTRKKSQRHFVFPFPRCFQPRRTSVPSTGMTFAGCRLKERDQCCRNHPPADPLMPSKQVLWFRTAQRAGRCVGYAYTRGCFERDSTFHEPPAKGLGEPIQPQNIGYLTQITGRSLNHCWSFYLSFYQHMSSECWIHLCQRYVHGKMISTWLHQHILKYLIP